MTNSEPPEQCEALNVSWCYHPITVRTSLLHLVAGLRAQGARFPCTHPQQVQLALSHCQASATGPGLRPEAQGFLR